MMIFSRGLASYLYMNSWNNRESEGHSPSHQQDLRMVIVTSQALSCGKYVSTGMIVLFRKESFPVCSGWGEVMC
jgi:Flp pilus assembly protein CpaB